MDRGHAARTSALQSALDAATALLGPTPPGVQPCSDAAPVAGGAAPREPAASRLPASAQLTGAAPEAAPPDATASPAAHQNGITAAGADAASAESAADRADEQVAPERLAQGDELAALRRLIAEARGVLAEAAAAAAAAEAERAEELRAKRERQRCERAERERERAERAERDKACRPPAQCCRRLGTVCRHSRLTLLELSLACICLGPLSTAAMHELRRPCAPPC